MRRTNFVAPVRARPGRIAVLVWVLAAALFAGGGYAFLQAGDAVADAEKLETHAVRLGGELAELGSSDAAVPTEAAFAELAGRVARLNELAGARHTALPEVLAALEAALPPDVWVGQMSYSVETGAFAVSLLGETETELPAALQRIEAIPALSDVILERQVRVQAGARNLLQYDIRAVAE